MPSAKPTIVAHRGLHHHCPENSLGAFMAAAEAGIPWVECDVWPSADDLIVVIHDETLDRTTTGTGEVWRQPWERLMRLNLSSLPQNLQRLTDLMQGKPPGMLVEIKPKNAARLVRSVVNALRMFYPFPWMVQSFDPSNIYHAWAIDPGIPAAFLVETAAELYGAIESGFPVIHAHHESIDRAAVERMRRANQHIGAWTVDAPADIQRLIDLGVDMIITDEPELAMRMCV